MVIPDLRHEYRAIDLGEASAAVFHDTISDGENNAVPLEITHHSESARDDKDAVPAGVTGQGEISVNISHSRTGSRTQVDAAGIVAVHVGARGSRDVVDKVFETPWCSEGLSQRAVHIRYGRGISQTCV